MDSTTVVAIVGILGTLIAPLVAGRVQRKAAKEDRVYAERVAVYVDLLEVVGHLADNAMTWSAVPLAELSEPDTERLRAVYARVRVVGSDRVFAASKKVSELSGDFMRDLWPARLRHHHDLSEGVGSGEAVQLRFALGRIADEFQSAVQDLETAVRREMKP